MLEAGAQCRGGHGVQVRDQAAEIGVPVAVARAERQGRAGALTEWVPPAGKAGKQIQISWAASWGGGGGPGLESCPGQLETSSSSSEVAR